MKTIYNILIGTLIIVVTLVTAISCSSSKEVYTDVTDSTEIKFERSGAQLWGETCMRCHLAPSPSSYNDVDWSTIGLHMRIRANLTQEDSNKIFDFLRSAN